MCLLVESGNYRHAQDPVPYIYATARRGAACCPASSFIFLCFRTQRILPSSVLSASTSSELYIFSHSILSPDNERIPWLFL